MVQTRIVNSFENSRKIVAVARESIGLRANYVLQPDLRNFEAMYFYGGRRSSTSGSSPSWCACPTGRSSASPPSTLRARPRRQGAQGRRGLRPGAGQRHEAARFLDACVRRAATSRRANTTATISTSYRNPANAFVDSENCPKGNDASMVPSDRRIGGPAVRPGPSPATSRDRPARGRGRRSSWRSPTTHCRRGRACRRPARWRRGGTARRRRRNPSGNCWRRCARARPRLFLFSLGMPNASKSMPA